MPRGCIKKARRFALRISKHCFQIDSDNPHLPRHGLQQAMHLGKLLWWTFHRGPYSHELDYNMDGKRPQTMWDFASPGIVLGISTTKECTFTKRVGWQKYLTWMQRDRKDLEIHHKESYWICLLPKNVPASIQKSGPTEIFYMDESTDIVQFYTTKNRTGHAYCKIIYLRLPKRVSW